jgi:hypothetical protein
LGQGYFIGLIAWIVVTFGIALRSTRLRPYSGEAVSIRTPPG